MEFRFDLKPIFSQPIARVGVNLLPHTFRGDRRSALDTTTKMQEIINIVGENSAKAQGLTKAVTTSQKLRQSENQKIYLLVDVDDGKRGTVIGMLKVGKKSLYVFDQAGTTQMVEAPCILDFYIHESRQRAGLGKDLFESMLQEEQWEPNKLAIDRPSDKLLGFLRKHYGLEKTIPQMNNFVIFEGFFDSTENGNVINDNNYNNQEIKVTSSPNTALFGPLLSSEDRIRRSRAEKTASPNPLNGIQNNPIGRYAASRPTCSMAEIKSKQNIKQSPSQISAVSNASQMNGQKPMFNNMTRTSVSRPFGEKRSGLQDMDIGTYYQVHFGNRSNFGNPQLPSPIDPQVIQQQQQQQMQMQHQLQQQNTSAQQLQSSQMTPQLIQQSVQNNNSNNNIATQHQPQIPQQQVSQQHIPNQTASQQQIAQQQLSQQQISITPSQQNVQEPHSCYGHENPADQLQHHQMQQQQQIIHSTAGKKSTGEPNSYAPSNDDQGSHVTSDDIDAVRANFEQLETSDLVTEPDENPELEPEPEIENEPNSELPDETVQSEAGTNGPALSDAAGTPTSQTECAKGHNLVNDRYKGNKQHTGMKNMSFGVGAAVTPTTKMEFYQEQPADFGIVKINQPAGKSIHSNDDNASVISSVTSGDGFTGHGYYDLKFHHNKLW